MTYDSINLLESAIHITKERDKRSLASSLLEILADYLVFDSALLLTVPFAEKADHLEIMSSVILSESLSRDYERPDLKIEYDDLILKSINNCENVAETIDDITRSIFPIAVGKSVINLVIIYHQNEKILDKKLIHGFLRIYGNFIALLNDNERDTLTGLLNRRTFDTLISELLEKIDNKQNPPKISTDRREPDTDACHWMGVLDIDHFKDINDNFGHLFGDEVLMRFADIMDDSFRSHDLLFRYGGEEFVVVISKTTEENAVMVFERFRKRLEVFQFPQVSQVTVSIGIAKIMPDTHQSTVIEQADMALYYSKNHGRNQLSNYHQLVELGEIKERVVATGEVELF